MGLFGKKKKVKDTVIRNTIGDEIHVRETPSGTIEESEAGEGHPTMESTYEDDYGEYYGGIEPSNDDDEF